MREIPVLFSAPMVRGSLSLVVKLLGPRHTYLVAHLLCFHLITVNLLRLAIGDQKQAAIRCGQLTVRSVNSPFTTPFAVFRNSIGKHNQVTNGSCRD